MFIATLFTIAKRWKQPKCPSTNEMDKQIVIYPYNGILFGHKKDWNTDTCYHMDEPWKHCSKWKSSVTKDHILYDSIHMKCPQQGTL